MNSSNKSSDEALQPDVVIDDDNSNSVFRNDSFAPYSSENDSGSFYSEERNQEEEKNKFEPPGQTKVQKYYQQKYGDQNKISEENLLSKLNDSQGFMSNHEKKSKSKRKYNFNSKNMASSIENMNKHRSLH